MKFARIAIAASLAMGLGLGGCAEFNKAQQIVSTAVTTAVPAEVVTPAANSFNILKAAATNYGRYCIKNEMAPAVCSADTRRKVVQFVRSGTIARDQLVANLEDGKPALSTVYNLLITAVDGLSASPVVSFKGK